MTKEGFVFQNLEDCVSVSVSVSVTVSVSVCRVCVGCVSRVCRLSVSHVSLYGKRERRRMPTGMHCVS